MIKKKSGFSLNGLIFSLFWWFVQRVSPKHGERLLYWGLKSGAFPNASKFDPILAVEVLGAKLTTPIGVSSGFDNTGNVIDDLIFMGAGFGEFGPYTLEKENPTVETFYLPKDKAIITQSLGYKNNGLTNMVPLFVNRRYLPNTISIALTITAENEQENVKHGRVMSYLEEFTLMIQKVAPYTDAITLDFSHPETELSRLVADGSTMIPLLQKLKQVIAEAAPIQRPRLLIRIPLNLTPLETPIVCQNLMAAGVDGVIVAGGLSLAQQKVRLSKNFFAGVLTGAPTLRPVLELINKVHQFTKGQLPIIACGGVMDGLDAYSCIAAGASLIQLDSAIRFDGPKAITRINRELAALLRRKGLKSVQEAVGIDFY